MSDPFLGLKYMTPVAYVLHATNGLPVSILYSTGMGCPVAETCVLFSPSCNTECIDMGLP